MSSPLAIGEATAAELLDEAAELDELARESLPALRRLAGGELARRLRNLARCSRLRAGARLLAAAEQIEGSDA